MATLDWKEIGERVKTLREKGGLSQQLLAEKLGLGHKVSISKIEKGLQRLSADQLVDASEILGVSIHQILWGKDESVGKGLGKDEGTEDEGVPIIKTRLIPLIEGALRAGEHGYEFTVEDLTLHYAEQVPVPIEHIKKAGPHCLIRVEGDSMEPMYYDGDVVLVNLRQQNLETLIGKPVAAWVPDLGGGLIKILKGCYRQDQWILHSINNRRPDIPVAKDQPHFRVFEIEALVYQPRKVAA